MKTITTAGILSLLLFICMSATPVKQKQTNVLQIKKAASPSFAFFRTHRQGRGITAAWGVSSNAGISGFRVEKTDQDPIDALPEDWTPVSSFPCSASKSYKCTDNNVSGGFISYRVIAIMSDNTEVSSEISTEHIVKH